MILGGDVGGTRTRLALYDVASSDEKLLRQPLFQQELSSTAHASLPALVEAFLSQAPRVAIDGICLGLPGPVVEGRCVTPNLPWQVGEDSLSHIAEKVEFINDLEATAYGISELRADELEVLNQGCDSATTSIGVRAVIAAGTGLGMSIAVRFSETTWRVLPSEGGHAEFGPRNETEVALLRFLMQRFEHVSVERVLSGPGLVLLYEFATRLVERDRIAVGVAESIRQDPDSAPAVIAGAGADGSCPACKKALGLFCGIYGAAAGNLALTSCSVGGVFVAGRIAVRLLGALKEGEFLAAFADKGRLRSFVRKIPVFVVLNDEVGLLGAARRCALSTQAPP